MLIDSHVHLDLPELAADLPAVLARSRAAGVGRWIVPAIEARGWDALADLCRREAGVAYGLGLHPWFLAGARVAQLRDLARRLAARPAGLVAVGECGLDAQIPVPMGRQIRYLTAQILLAGRHRLPLILHSRKTHAPLLALLQRHRPAAGGVIHGFNGSYEQALAFWKLGFCLGVGGTITYPRAGKTRQAVARLPLEALLLETDAPSMPLAGHQGQANEPARAAEVLACLAELRQMAPDELAVRLNANARRLFRLDAGG